MKMTMVALMIFVTLTISGVPCFAEGLIYGCYHKNNGQLRIVSGLGQCLPSEISIQWNLAGPKGDKGDPGPPGPAAIEETGDVRGIVRYCGGDGFDGIFVYIPGKSFGATTGSNGEFALYSIPEGSYDLIIAPPKLASYSINGVQVKKGEITNLGTIYANEGAKIPCPKQYGVCSGSFTVCENGVMASCTAANYGPNYSETEICNDGLDNNCDGLVDNGCGVCTDGQQRLCPLQSGVCNGSFTTCTNGVWPTCTDANYGPNYRRTEICNDGLDNNCDGLIDLADLSCQGTQTCAQATYLGEICGDNQGGVVTATGYGNRWYKVYARECSILPRDLSFTVRLTPPPGVDYDLYVYDDRCQSLYGQSRNGGSAVETLTLLWNDTLGADDNYYFLINIRYVSGSSAANWYLEIFGGQ